MSEVQANGVKPPKKSHHKRRKKASANAEQALNDGYTSRQAVANVPDVEIEYVVEKPEGLDPELSEVFDKFTAKPIETTTGKHEEATTTQVAIDDILNSLADDFNKETSKKQLKKRQRPTVAQLKQIVSRPAVVDVHDVTSPDPELLVFLKSRRNAVNIPRHWANPQRYLSGKRPSDRKPYQLPEYIAATGIGKLREATDDANDLLQKRQRERARPKLGRIEIDYQVLYDAFFKYQTKPRLTKHGELYYEGKEQEKDFSKFIPGVLSEELRQALGMSEGYPPPWLSRMQELGPPPSYPTIKYPGVNAPLPPGATYGTAPGQWGKPPLDQYKRGLWGDVLGTSTPEMEAKPLKVRLWGGFERDDTEEEEQESLRKRARVEEEEESEEEEEAGAQLEQPALAVAPAQAPVRQVAIQELVPEEEIDLRKRPTQAHRVLQAVETSAGASADVFGASHKYSMSNTSSSGPVAVNPEDVEAGLAKQELERLYDESRAKKVLGIAPGAGHVDVAEIEKEVQKAKKSKSTKDKKKEFKF